MLYPSLLSLFINELNIYLKVKASFYHIFEDTLNNLH